MTGGQTDRRTGLGMQFSEKALGGKKKLYLLLSNLSHPNLNIFQSIKVQSKFYFKYEPQILK